MEARKFNSEDWTCTRKELIAAIEESDIPMADEKEVEHWLSLNFHLIPKGDRPNDKQIATVLTIAGAFDAPKKKRKKRKKAKQKISMSLQEFLDLPDWKPFEGGCFIGVTKQDKGKRKHGTIYIDLNGWRLLEKASFVPPDTQPRIGFETADIVEWDEIFGSLVKTFKEYIWFADEQYYYVLAACAMSTFFREIFDTFPYCDFYAAELNCGKTTAMKALIWSSFHGFMPLDPTGPVIFRAVDSCKSAIGIDELDNLLKDPDSQSRILGLLNAAYQKGLVAYRIAMEEGGMPIPYDPFGLKGFTHVNPIPESIQSRSIVFSLIRSPHKIPLLRTAAVFDLYRDQMYKMRLVAMAEVEDAYKWVLDFVDLANRPKDIFTPPLTMAKLVSDEVFNEMYRWAREYAEALQTEQFDEVKRNLVEILLNYTGDVKVKYLAEELSTVCHERGLTKGKEGEMYYFHSRTVLRMLASMGIHKTPTRTDGNIHVRILSDRVKKWAVAYRLKIPDADEPTAFDELVTKKQEVGPEIESKSEHFAPNGKKDTSSSLSSESLTKDLEESTVVHEDNDENDLSGGTSALNLAGFLEVSRTPAEGQVPDILKKIIRRWRRDKTAYINGIRVEDDKDVELFLKGLEAGYVRELMPSGFWFLTDTAREEIDRWGL